jgi:hypothetical protein
MTSQGHVQHSADTWLSVANLLRITRTTPPLVTILTASDARVPQNQCTNHAGRSQEHLDRERNCGPTVKWTT